MTKELSFGIIEAVADHENADPMELDVVLSDYIDLNAVNQLAEHDNSSWLLTFDLPEHRVTVTSEGVILVDGNQEKNLTPA